MVGAGAQIERNGMKVKADQTRQAAERQRLGRMLDEHGFAGAVDQQ
jgi:hypothetical protein